LSNPTYTSEYTAGAWAVLRDLIVPAWLRGENATVVGHRAAKWSVETAALDHHGRIAGRSIADLLAGELGARRRVTTAAVISGCETADELIDRVETAVARGHRLVKTKLTSPADIDALEEVRHRWPELALAADANGMLRAGDTRLFDEIETLGLVYLEQPLPADDLIGSARLASRLHTAVVLDESIESAGQVATVSALEAADGVNVKPGRLGLESVAAARAARAAGLDVVCGGMLETGIGRAAALAVAALAECTLPTDLGPSASYFAPGTDLAGPFELQADGELAVPEGAGLGVEPDLDRLDDATVERVVLRV
jgi:O-succinylbenzoate synthase